MINLANIKISFFSSDKSLNTDNSRLFNVRPSLDELLGKFQQLYTLKSNVVIDESPITFRDRHIFSYYIPVKSHKYGCKLYKLCSLLLIPGIFRSMLGNVMTFFFI